MVKEDNKKKKIKMNYKKLTRDERKRWIKNELNRIKQSVDLGLAALEEDHIAITKIVEGIEDKAISLQAITKAFSKDIISEQLIFKGKSGKINYYKSNKNVYYTIDKLENNKWRLTGKFKGEIILNIEEYLTKADAINFMRTHHIAFIP